MMMIRLQTCNLIHGEGCKAEGGICRSSGSACFLRAPKTLGSRRLVLLVTKALKDERNGGANGGFVGKNWDPGLEIQVPYEQRPVCMLICFYGRQNKRSNSTEHGKFTFIFHVQTVR